MKYLVKFPGEIWLRMLKMAAMPLIVANLITSVALLREHSTGGLLTLSWMTGIFYLGTTILAAIESIILLSIILIPNLKVIAKSEIQKEAPSDVFFGFEEQILSLIEQIVPKNIVYASVKGNFIGMIVFSLLIGSVVSFESKFLKFFSDL